MPISRLYDNRTYVLRQICASKYTGNYNININE